MRLRICVGMVILGLTVMAVGVGMILGLAYALVLLGIACTVIGLLGVDVDSSRLTDNGESAQQNPKPLRGVRTGR